MHELLSMSFGPLLLNWPKPCKRCECNGNGAISNWYFACSSEFNKENILQCITEHGGFTKLALFVRPMAGYWFHIMDIGISQFVLMPRWINQIFPLSPLLPHGPMADPYPFKWNTNMNSPHKQSETKNHGTMMMAQPNLYCFPPVQCARLLPMTPYTRRKLFEWKLLIEMSKIGKLL